MSVCSFLLHYRKTFCFWTSSVVYSDFYKAFDTVSLHILISKLERYGFEGLTSRWIGSWLDGHSIAVNGSMSRWRLAINDVPQGFILDLLLFDIFINDISMGSSALSSSLQITPS